MRIRSFILPFLLLAAFAFGYWQWFFVADAKGYQKLLTKGQNLSSTEEVAPSFQQHREKVTKDFWINQNGQRLHLQVKSKVSQLELEGGDMVEKMQYVDCLMQEELYYQLPNGKEVTQGAKGKWVIRNEKQSSVLDLSEAKPMQLLRFMESDDAVYYFKNDRFVARKVQIRRYKVPGHTLPRSIEGITPILAGTAKTVELSLLKSNVKLKAQHLKATLYSVGAK